MASKAGKIRTGWNIVSAIFCPELDCIVQTERDRLPSQGMDTMLKERASDWFDLLGRRAGGHGRGSKASGKPIYAFASSSSRASGALFISAQLRAAEFDSRDMLPTLPLTCIKHQTVDHILPDAPWPERSSRSARGVQVGFGACHRAFTGAPEPPGRARGAGQHQGGAGTEGEEGEFEVSVRKLERTFENFETLHNFQGVYILVGAHINEDAELARFGSTGTLDQLPARLRLTADDFLGAAKVLAYSGEIDAVQAGQLKNAPSMSASPEASTSAPKASRTRRATSTTRTKATHLTQQQKDVVAKAAKNARAKEGQARINNIRVVAHVLAQNDYRIIGFPLSVRPPPYFSGKKGAGSLHLKELDALEEAITARKGSVYGGLRVEPHTYKAKGIVIFLHDYDRHLPSEDPKADAVKKFWRTSGDMRERIIDGLGDVWSAPYDIDKDPMVTTSQRQRVWASDTQKADKSTKSKPVKGKGKAREVAVPSDSDEYAEGSANEDEYEDEEPTLPIPRVTRAMVAVQEGGGPAPKKATTKPATASTKPTAPANTASTKPAAPAKAAASKAPSKPALKAPNPPPASGKKHVEFAADDDDDDASSAAKRKVKKPVRRKVPDSNSDASDAPPPPAKRKRCSPSAVAKTEDEDDDDVPLGNRRRPRARLNYVATPPQFVQGSSRGAQGGQASAPWRLWSTQF
ncbi:hypothetical protein B0H11DRAFT_1940832 [Mycena galericulata]|nr:hypothetical protein B0H11DRAFT_1940832 [Mycena galericulata]